MTIVRLIRLVLLIGLLSVAAPVQAQFGARQSTSGTGKIDVTADNLSSSDGTNQIEATGNVEIKRDQMTLKADEVRMNRQTQDIEAKGNISLDDPEWKVRSADQLQFNLEKESGQLSNGNVFIEQGHISMAGKRIEKLEGQTYHVEDGFFTTCLCDQGNGTPHWKFSAEDMEMTLRGLGIIKAGYFYILDTPVFYIPYAFFPLKTDRQTGLLSPSYGHSTKEGFRFLQPFFWAISKNTDATFAGDIESNARLGVMGEFRTIFKDLSDFRLNTAYFSELFRKDPEKDVVDRTIANQHIPQNRGAVIDSHRYTTDSDWLTYSDIAIYSDDLFTRELIDRFELPGTLESSIRVSRFSESRLGVFKGWGDRFFKAEYKYYQDFIQYDAETLQRAPQATFWGRRFFSSFPLELRWRTEAVNYLRRRGGDGLRLDLRPEAVLPYNFGSYLFGDVSVAPRATLYHLYTTVTSVQNPVRPLVEIRGNTATSFSRIFDWTMLGLKGVKHVIEPRVDYLFVSGSHQDNIPIMDAVDRVNARNVMTFSVTNRFWGKPINPFRDFGVDTENLSAYGAADVRDLGSFRLAMGYDFTNNISRDRPGSGGLTDLDMSLRFNPLGYSNFTVDGGIDPRTGNITQARATVALSDPRPLRRSLDADFNRPNMLAVSYSFLKSGPNGYLAEDANINLGQPADCGRFPDDPRCPGSVAGQNILGGLSTTVLYHFFDNFVGYSTSTYDAKNNKFIGFSVSGKLLSTCECWAVTAGIRHTLNPAKTSFGFDFNLLGLGAPRSTLK